MPNDITKLPLPSLTDNDPAPFTTFVDAFISVQLLALVAVQGLRFSIFSLSWQAQPAAFNPLIRLEKPKPS
jgi:hypothetical protein